MSFRNPHLNLLYIDRIFMDGDGDIVMQIDRGLPSFTLDVWKELNTGDNEELDELHREMEELLKRVHYYCGYNFPVTASLVDRLASAYLYEFGDDDTWIKTTEDFAKRMDWLHTCAEELFIDAPHPPNLEAIPPLPSLRRVLCNTDSESEEENEMED